MKWAAGWAVCRWGVVSARRRLCYQAQCTMLGGCMLLCCLQAAKEDRRRKSAPACMGVLVWKGASLHERIPFIAE